MVSLPNVTVILYDGLGKTETSAKVMSHILSVVSPAAVQLVSPAPPSGPWTSVKVPHVSWIEGQKMQTYGFEFETSHMLMCELDGFPLNAHLWDPAWMKYDYIGAPWGVEGCATRSYSRHRVGNGGCSLQSRAIRRMLFRNRHLYPEGTPSDLFICQVARRLYFLRKFQFAPICDAIKFSFEASIPEYPGWTTDNSFAFHGKTFHPQHCFDL